MNTREPTNICLCLTYVVAIDKIGSHLLLKYQSSTQDRVCYMRCQQNVPRTWACYLTLCQSMNSIALYCPVFPIHHTLRADCFRIIFAGQVLCISHYESYRHPSLSSSRQSSRNESKSVHWSRENDKFRLDPQLRGPNFSAGHCLSVVLLRIHVAGCNKSTTHGFGRSVRCGKSGHHLVRMRESLIDNCHHVSVDMFVDVFI